MHEKIDLDQYSGSINIEDAMEKSFKDPFNIFHFIGFILVLLIPTLPASLSWLKISGLL
ncbi:hypothetical protein [uncultured Shewanella sp.]|uniref:hypothetical protein n=1 Tax=uncultured Shewanella sp. TaxID=173975 RepID=UPI00262716F8|nr:hypothetical protein [uncultured Shewanella sp.]